MNTKRRLQLSASPLMVAVALGFLGPAALEEEENTSAFSNANDPLPLSSDAEATPENYRAAVEST